MKSTSLQRSVPVLGLVLALASLAPSVRASEPQTGNTTGEVKTLTQEVSPELMRSFLHLQEQVHAMQIAVERSRMQSELAAERQADALKTRMEAIENALAQARLDSSSAMQEAGRQIQASNRTVMVLAGVFATLGFLALALTGYLQWKTIARLNGSPSPLAFPALLSSQSPGVLPGFSAAALAGSGRLMESLHRLEHRIAEMAAGNSKLNGAGGSVVLDPGTTGSDVSDELSSLIREGEELLAHEEAEKAIAHFDAVLTKHPGHPEVLLRKGAALERLQRDQEALACYDEAIRADKNLTMAYLHKGGLYNRMERFSEAMECYEQALRVQEGRSAVS